MKSARGKSKLLALEMHSIYTILPIIGVRFCAGQYTRLSVFSMKSIKHKSNNDIND